MGTCPVMERSFLTTPTPPLPCSALQHFFFIIYHVIYSFVSAFPRMDAL